MRKLRLVIAVFLCLAAAESVAQDLDVSSRIDALIAATRAKDAKAYITKGYGYDANDPQFKQIDWPYVERAQGNVAKKLGMPFTDGLTYLPRLKSIPMEYIQTMKANDAHILQMRLRVLNGVIPASGTGNFMTKQGSKSVDVKTPPAVTGLKLRKEVLEIVLKFRIDQGEFAYMAVGSLFSAKAMTGMEMSFDKKNRSWVIHEIDGSAMKIKY